MSYKPARSKAYGSDIRWRIVYQLRVLDYSAACVSSNLGVSVSTVRHIGKVFDETGNVDTKDYFTGGHRVRRSSPHGMNFWYWSWF